MTEYTVKEIGHQWIVYADRLSIAACADEDSALKLIAEDSAANSALRKLAGIRQAKTRRREPAG
jgi:predicted DNA-binding helix-hairpin-helix protein